MCHFPPAVPPKWQQMKGLTGYGFHSAGANHGGEAMRFGFIRIDFFGGFVSLYLKTVTTARGGQGCRSGERRDLQQELSKV